jgi:signal transduction histidine kinase
MNDTQRYQLLSLLKHDLNNVLTGVKTGLEIMAMDDYFEDPDNAQDIKDVITASIRMANMLDDLSLVFGDCPEAILKKQEVLISDLLAKLEKQCQLEAIDINIAPHDVKSLQADLATLTRSIYYAIILVFEHQNEPVRITFSTHESNGECHIMMTQETFNALKNALKDPKQDRLRNHARLSKLALDRLQGKWTLGDSADHGGIIKIKV